MNLWDVLPFICAAQQHYKTKRWDLWVCLAAASQFHLQIITMWNIHIFSHKRFFFYLFVFTYHFQLMVFTLSPRVYMASPTQLYENFNIYIRRSSASPSSTSTNLSILFNNETFLLREMMLLLVADPIPNAHYILQRNKFSFVLSIGTLQSCFFL